jgi:polysaccharide pyruvyl transferase WcaK-like protein
MECIKRIMKEKPYAITTSLNETLEAYKSLSYVVGMRYHSAIIAAAHAVPVLMVPYGPKSLELIKILEIPDHIESGFFTHEEFFIHWDTLVENYDARKVALKEKYDTIHKELIKKLDDI